MKLDEALQEYMRDARARGLRPSSLAMYESLWRRWLAYAESQGLRMLEDWTAQELRHWRESWTWSSGTHRDRLGKIKAFFNFAVRQDFLSHETPESTDLADHKVTQVSIKRKDRSVTRRRVAPIASDESGFLCVLI